MCDLDAVITGAECKQGSCDADFFGAQYIAYNITVTRGDRSWHVQRRFSNFTNLFVELERKFGKDANFLEAPPKRAIENILAKTDVNSPFVQKRVTELGKFINQVLSDTHISRSAEVLKFFEDWRELRRMKSETNSLDDGPQEIQLKVLFTGDFGCGKTSLIKRYAQNKFAQNYLPTLGVDFALKELTWQNGAVIRLQLWDIAGQERFSGFTQIYYKEAVAAFVVFDLTRAATFHSVPKWKRDIDTNTMGEDGTTIPVVLLANKSDSYNENDPKNGPDGDGISLSCMDEFCKEHGFIGWFQTSAKDNANVNEAAMFLVRSAMQKEYGGMIRESTALGTPMAKTEDRSVDSSSCILSVR